MCLNMFDRIVNETYCNLNPNQLLIIYGFNDDFVIGGYWHTKFYLEVIGIGKYPFFTKII